MKTTGTNRPGPIRLTGGEAGGALIFSPPGLTARPALARVRAALFNMLGDVSGASALDLFAGTGALGFEALSSGAASAVFFERDPACLEAIRLTAEKLGMAGRAKIAPGDVFGEVARFAGANADLAFVDPPYVLIDEPEERPKLLALLSMLAASGAVRPGALVVVEHRANVVLGAPPGLDADDRRVYGQTALAFFRCASGSRV